MFQLSSSTIQFVALFFVQLLFCCSILSGHDLSAICARLQQFSFIVMTKHHGATWAHCEVILRLHFHIQSTSRMTSF